jgi:O-antigen ligase
VAIWTGARRWRLRAIALVVLVSLAALAVPAVRERVASIGSRSTGSDRAFIWAMSAQITGDHRLGIGLANYPTYSATYYDAAESPFKFVPRTYPHSLVMAAWAESGPVGLGGYVAMWVALASAAVAGLRRRGDSRSVSAATALLLLVVTFWVVGVTHDVLFHKPVALTFSAVVGASLAQLRRQESSP